MQTRIRAVKALFSQGLSPDIRHFAAGTQGHQWKWLKDHGHNINPCNSKLHPAVTTAGLEPESEKVLCVQEAYSPESTCWGCGPASTSGLKLQSFRSIGGLSAEVSIPQSFQAFPGIINGGIISTLFDCHGNWSAAIALMDKAALPRPPFTLSHSIQVTYREPTPPETPLMLQSKVVKIDDNKAVGYDTVTVELTLHQVIMDEEKKLLAVGSGTFKKYGALRAL